ncbi:MAG: Fic family protein [Acetobacteraceae bacterium]
MPPRPPVRLEGKLQVLLSAADRALGRLYGSVQTLPNPDLFVAMYVRKEAVLSSQIEGTQSSLQDVLAAEAQMFGADARPGDVKEVLNYIKAMNHGLSRLPDIAVSVRLIREIHEKLMTGVRGGTLTPGEVRRSQNWIGPQGCTLANASYVPPPPHLIGDELANMETFLHQKDNVPDLIRIGITHAQFETIHPFLDGNGRVGRLLITFLLTESGALNKPVLYLSHYFKRYRQLYYERLQAVRDKGDWEGWLEFFLRGVAEVSTEASGTAGRILRMREEHRAMITARLGRAAGNGHKVLESLFNRPIVSVANVVGVTGTTNPAANNLVRRLTELNILKEITGYVRHRRFRYQPYVQIFAEDDPQENMNSAPL